jgi:hypothetical protein
MEREMLPVGFGMALAMNPSAMERFSAMSKQEQEAVLERSRHAGSKREMQELVASLEQNGPTGGSAIG